MNYPIKDEYNALIREGIETQKKKIEIMKRNKINYYKITDPVYKIEHVNIFANTNIRIKNSRNTKDLCEHFNNKKDLLMIYNNDLHLLKRKLIKELSLFILLSIVFLVLIFLDRQLSRH